MHEVHANGFGLGLAIALRKDAGLVYNLVETKEDVILISVKTENTSVVIGNIYRSPNPEKTKVTTKRIAELLKKYSENSTCLFSGDWNVTPECITKKLLKNGIQVYANKAPTKGTRVQINRRRTSKPIDFGVCSRNDVILSQNCGYNWMISDHLPGEIKVNLTYLKRTEKAKMMFDRKLLSNRSIVDKIVNYNYDQTDGISTFHSKLDSLLKELKVMREVKPYEGKLQIKNSVKKAIKAKRLKEKEVRKGIASLDQLIEPRKNVAKATAVSKRKSYVRFIKEGIRYLKSNDSKNSWKWIKRHSKLNVNKCVTDMFYKEGTNVPETEPDKRLVIWVEHFRKLSIKGDPGKIEDPVTMYYPDIGYETDKPITWDEIRTVLRRLRKGKAAGNDMIPGEIYKLVEMRLNQSAA